MSKKPFARSLGILLDKKLFFLIHRNSFTRSYYFTFPLIDLLTVGFSDSNLIELGTHSREPFFTLTCNYNYYCYVKVFLDYSMVEIQIFFLLNGYYMNRITTIH